MRGDGGVASEGRVVGVPKFHSWGKYTVPLTNINSDWMSNPSSGLCIIYIIYIIYAGPLSCILGCNLLASTSSDLCTLCLNFEHKLNESVQHKRILNQAIRYYSCLPSKIPKFVRR